MFRFLIIVIYEIQNNTLQKKLVFVLHHKNSANKESHVVPYTKCNSNMMTKVIRFEVSEVGIKGKDLFGFKSKAKNKGN